MNARHFEALFKSISLPIGIEVLFEKRIHEWQQKNSISELELLLTDWKMEGLYNLLVGKSCGM